jgi:hypothetical protein
MIPIAQQPIVFSIGIMEFISNIYNLIGKINRLLPHFQIFKPEFNIVSSKLFAHLCTRSIIPTS